MQYTAGHSCRKTLFSWTVDACVGNSSCIPPKGLNSPFPTPFVFIVIACSPPAGCVQSGPHAQRINLNQRSVVSEGTGCAHKNALCLSEALRSLSACGAGESISLASLQPYRLRTILQQHARGLAVTRLLASSLNPKL